LKAAVCAIVQQIFDRSVAKFFKLLLDFSARSVEKLGDGGAARNVDLKKRLDL
jgi:hypothetical protein